jgi:hypothetical protein
VKFRRKSADPVAPEEDLLDDGTDAGEGAAGAGGPAVTGPYDADELPDDGLQRVDLGALLVPAVPGLELQVQVDEASQRVQSVLLAGPDGAVELRAFAAPRHGDLWTDVRPRIAADFAQRGGTASERDGRFGTELTCQVTVRAPDGRTGTQVSRVVGVNGPRWMLRATFLGRPAQDPAGAEPWEEVVEHVAVRRGTHAMPVGEQLELVLPAGARAAQEQEQAPEQAQEQAQGRAADQGPGA